MTSLELTPKEIREQLLHLTTWWVASFSEEESKSSKIEEQRNNFVDEILEICFAKKIAIDSIEGTTGDGFSCDACGADLDTRFNETWDKDHGFMMIPYLWCNQCKTRVTKTIK